MMEDVFFSVLHIATYRVSPPLTDEGGWQLLARSINGTVFPIGETKSKKGAKRKLKEVVQTISQNTGGLYFSIRDELWISADHIVRVYVDTNIDGSYACIVDDDSGDSHAIHEGMEDGCRSVMKSLATHMGNYRQS